MSLASDYVAWMQKFKDSELPVSVGGQLQMEIAAQLVTDPAFAKVAIIPQVLMNLSSELREQAGRLGVCCIVDTPEATCSQQVFQQAEPPHFDGFRVELEFSCYVPVAAVTAPGLDTQLLCESAASLLVGYRPTHASDKLTLASEGIGRAVKLERNEKDYAVVQSLHLECQSRLGVSMAKVSTPEYANTGNYPDSVTLSCDTSDSDIYFSITGDYPSPGANTYTAPVTVTGPCVLRARAWKSGARTSDELLVEFI